MVGIVSNTAALFAQRNLEAANSAQESSIARLSSGNAIVRASDDVAGLAVGTTLATTVSTLQTVLTSTAQASSLLSIADGGLQNIGDILQRQASLATQANSGSLSDNERSFLDQEFQNLVSEIDRLVENTNFNGVNLLDGAISGTNGLGTATGNATEDFSLNATADFNGSGALQGGGIVDNTVGNASGLTVVNSVETEAVAATGSFTLNGGTIGAGAAATQTITFTGTGTNGESINIGGQTFTFATNGDGSSITNIGLGTDATEAATNLVNAINSAAGQAALGNSVTAESTGGVVTLTAAANGTAGNAIAVADGGSFTNGSVDGANLAGGLDSDQISVNGENFTFVENGTASSGNTIEIGANNAETLQNIANALNDTGTNGGQGGARAANVGDFVFSATATTLTVTARNTGVANNGDVLAFTANDTTDTAVVTAVDVGLDATPGSTLGAAEVLNNDAATTFDASLQGGLSNLTAEFVAGSIGAADSFTANSVRFTVDVGGQTFESDLVALDNATVSGGAGTGNGLNGLGDVVGAGAIRFFQAGQSAGADANAGFTLTLNGSATEINDQTTAAALATSIQAELDAANVSLNQNRELSSFDTTAVTGTVLEGLDAQAVTLQSDNFLADGTFGNIGAFEVNVNNGTITTTIDDVEFTANLNNSDPTATNDDVTFAANVLSTDGRLVFESATADDGDQLILDLNAITRTATIDLGTEAQQQALESALNTAFDVGSSNGGLTFQVGTTADDAISLTLQDAGTQSIFLDDEGVAQTLDISTAEGAQQATEVVTNAINTITSLRATVGGLQSRFDFAASNIQSSIQNTEAARSSFLDTDVASESTAFATAQVQLQASVSVLAQANQLPQNLLELIRG